MTQVNWTRQLGLAVALVALGSVAYWLEFKHKPQKEAAEEQTKHVFNLKESPVQSIIIHDGAKKVTLTCSDFAAKLCKPGDNSKWEMSEPLRLKADDSNANALLSTLNTLTSNETIELKDETAEKRAALIKEYGLDANARNQNKKVEVTTSAGKTTLDLGLPHPIGESLFAIVNGDENRVLLIPNFFKSTFDHDLAYWRNKKLFTFGSHEVESFELTNSKTHLTAEKKEGKWILHIGSDELTGDIENIDNFLSTVTYLSAKNFVSDQKNDEKAKSVLKNLANIISIKLQKEQGTAKDRPEPVLLTLFQKKKGQTTDPLFATVSNLDPLFELEPFVRDRLDKNVKDFRLTKLITAMDRFSAKRLEISGAGWGSNPILFNNQDGKWIKASDKTEVPADKVTGILDKLSGNKIQEFLTGSAIPIGEKEGLKLTLGDEKTPEKRQLLFWKKESKLYARDLQSKRNEAFQVDPSLIEVLPWNPEFFTKTDTKPDAKSGKSKE